MIESCSGDLFAARVEALVNPVNCVGVMGKGLALEFKKRFPHCVEDYERVCREGLLQPGRCHVFDRGAEAKPRFIVHFPTKRHWRDSSQLGDIAAGLKELAARVDALSIRSMAMPALGCGLGGLDWKLVRDAIEAGLASTKAQVYVFRPLPA